MKSESELNEFTDERFDPPHPTLNVGTVRTSEDGVTLAGSCRLAAVGDRSGL